MTAAQWDEIYDLVTEVRWYAAQTPPQAFPHAKANRLVDLVVKVKPVGGGDTSTATAPKPPLANAGLTRIAVVVGHNSVQPGADGLAPVGMSEFQWNSGVAERMVEWAAEFGPIDVKTFYRAKSASYAAEIRDCYAKVAAWKPAAVLELHFNAADGSASGSEVLVANNAVTGPAGMLGVQVLAQMKEKLGLRERGLKPTGKSARGAGSLFATSLPTVICEPFFGDNGADVKAAGKLGQEGLAKMYLAAVGAWVRSR